MKKFAKNMKKAFTITELVIVIAVIAILAAVLIPTFSSVISSARESAAMQECHNALTNYSVEAEKNGKSTTGVVFVNNDYAFVVFNGSLQLLGKLDKLTNINSSGTLTGESPNEKLKIDKKSEGAAGSVEITITNESGDSEKPVTAELMSNDEHAAENLYVYSVKVNETTYVGYFTYEPSNAKYIIEENQTVYSRMLGYVALNDEKAAMKLEILGASE